MKFEKFVESTGRTWNAQEGMLDLDHALLGLVDEVGELASAFKKHVGYGEEIDIANVKEEIGDCTYFLARLLEGAKFDKAEDLYKSLDEVYDNELSEEDMKRVMSARHVDIAYGLTNMVNNVHGALVQGNGSELAQNVADMISTLSSTCVYFDTTLAECMEKNVEKLKVRYPEKFEANMAVNRDIDAERETLED